MAAPALATEDREASASAHLDAAAPSRVLSAWSEDSIQARLQVLKRARRLLAGRADEIADALSPQLSRNRADTLVAEVLPLLAAIKFLERQAAQILKPRRLGRKGLPFWLAGVESTVARVPLGCVLVIGPANYPIFLPGVQAMQALAAGNTVIWKPGRGGRAVADMIAHCMIEAGLPSDTLRVTDESLEAGISAIHTGVAKVFFTGSAEAGIAVQRQAAESSTPVVAELSGCDPVFVLPGADHARVIDALCFGMRLNGSATCMAPRRLFLVGEHGDLVERLRMRFAAIEPVVLNATTDVLLKELLEDSRLYGAEVLGEAARTAIRPLLVVHGSPRMRLAQSDLFAPVLSVFTAPTEQDALKMDNVCPLSLTASVFGVPSAAQAFAAKLNAGTVVVNDLIVPTADPRIAFGGRGASGFGVTRGVEGLLEMTAVRTTCVRTGKSRRHFQVTTAAHEGFFAGIIAASHAGTWRERIDGARKLIRAANQLQSATRNERRPR